MQNPSFIFSVMSAIVGHVLCAVGCTTTTMNDQSYFWLHAQMLQRVVAVAAESLKVLEHQLMDGSQTQDVRVGTKRLNAWIHSLNH